MSQIPRISITYSFGNLKFAAHEEIVGFEVDVAGGGFESMSSLPKGWHVAIDNKSDTETALNADLSFGGGALSVEQFQAIVITLSQVEPANKKLTLLGHVMVSNLGSERRVQLTNQNFLHH